MGKEDSGGRGEGEGRNSKAHTYNILQVQHSKAQKPTIFNNGYYTSNIPTDPHALYTYMYVLYLGMRGFYGLGMDDKCGLENIFIWGSTLAQLQINHPSSNHIYTKSTPNHIHHHYAPSVILKHTTHIISSTSPTLSSLDLGTYLAGVTALLARWLEKLAVGPQAGTSDSPH